MPVMARVKRWVPARKGMSCRKGALSFAGWYVVAFCVCGLLPLATLKQTSVGERSR